MRPQDGNIIRASMCRNNPAVSLIGRRVVDFEHFDNAFQMTWPRK